MTGPGRHTAVNAATVTGMTNTGWAVYFRAFPDVPLRNFETRDSALAWVMDDDDLYFVARTQ